MKKNYLSNPSYNYDQVNRASLACGPMVKWAIAQVRTISSISCSRLTARETRAPPNGC